MTVFQEVSAARGRDETVPDTIFSSHAASGVHGQVYAHRERLPLRLLWDGLEKLRYDEVMVFG